MGWGSGTPSSELSPFQAVSSQIFKGLPSFWNYQNSKKSPDVTSCPHSKNLGTMRLLTVSRLLSAGSLFKLRGLHLINFTSICNSLFYYNERLQMKTTVIRNKHIVFLSEIYIWKFHSLPYSYMKLFRTSIQILSLCMICNDMFIYIIRETQRFNVLQLIVCTLCATWTTNVPLIHICWLTLLVQSSYQSFLLSK
jgi:hypothetical protein